MPIHALVEIDADPVISRRNLFSIAQSVVTGCLACAAAGQCANAQAQPPSAATPWSEKSDMTWEAIFRFAYQKDYIPLMKGLADRIGEDQFLEMLKQTGTDIVEKKNASRPNMSFDFSRMVAGMKNPPPLFARTLVGEVVRETPQVFEYRVTQCLWAKTFRESNAGAIGYAVVCHPDFAVARGLSPKLKLTRAKTLMQGDECCGFRYEMES